MSAAVLQRESAAWRASQLPELLTRKQALDAAAANGLTFTEQLRSYLTANFSRVIDLLRQWDEDEDGEPVAQLELHRTPSFRSFLLSSLERCHVSTQEQWPWNGLGVHGGGGRALPRRD